MTTERAVPEGWELDPIYSWLTRQFYGPDIVGIINGDEGAETRQVPWTMIMYSSPSIKLRRVSKE